MWSHAVPGDSMPQRILGGNAAPHNQPIGVRAGPRIGMLLLIIAHKGTRDERDAVGWIAADGEHDRVHHPGVDAEQHVLTGEGVGRCSVGLANEREQRRNE